jgi:hypothetical protein
MVHDVSHPGVVHYASLYNEWTHHKDTTAAIYATQEIHGRVYGMGSGFSATHSESGKN